MYCVRTEPPPRMLRHMYFHMARFVNESLMRGFTGKTIEAAWGEKWKNDHLDMLSTLEKGGMILFGGHGTASVSCLVTLDDVSELNIGPSIVINGACYGATTHKMIAYGDDSKPHRLVRAIDPDASIALQLLRKGAVGYIGGATKCSFGHVEPAIAMLRDENRSLGETLKLIQNHFIDPVPLDGNTWEAKGMNDGDPGFAKVDERRETHPTLIQFTIRTICLGDPAFVPFPSATPVPQE